MVITIITIPPLLRDDMTVLAVMTDQLPTPYFILVPLALTTAHSTETTLLKWPPSCWNQCNFIFHSLISLWAFDFLPLEMPWHLEWYTLLILLAHLVGVFLCSSFSPSCPLWIEVTQEFDLETYILICQAHKTKFSSLTIFQG